MKGGKLLKMEVDMPHDFHALRRIPIVDVCKQLDIVLKPKGSHYRGWCPLCKHPSERAFVVTPKMQRWCCHATCKEGGDSLELVVRFKQVPHTEAASWLVRTFGS